MTSDRDYWKNKVNTSVPYLKVKHSLTLTQGELCYVLIDGDSFNYKCMLMVEIGYQNGYLYVLNTGGGNYTYHRLVQSNYDLTFSTQYPATWVQWTYSTSSLLVFASSDKYTIYKINPNDL